jgi:hypothetical protein
MMTQDQAVPGTRKSFVTSLLISSTLVAPFIVLQWVNRRAFHEDFPFMLFTFMSLHSLFIVLLLTLALRCLRSARNLRALKLGQWAGLVLSASSYLRMPMWLPISSPASSGCRIAAKASGSGSRAVYVLAYK